MVAALGHRHVQETGVLGDVTWKLGTGKVRGSPLVETEKASGVVMTGSDAWWGLKTWGGALCKVRDCLTTTLYLKLRQNSIESKL